MTPALGRSDEASGTRDALEPTDGADGESRGGAPSVGSVFRAARQYRGWSLREVERRTGRDNAYLSQVERGIIRKPDPAVVVELAELYGLNFELVALWAGLTDERDEGGGASELRTLVKAFLELRPADRKHALVYVDELLRRSRT
jgi:transcriptional regulator with XRE-family HTH domain